MSNGAGGLPGNNVEEGQRTADDSTFPQLPPYEFGPPKYESLELTESPPKYEDIMNPGQSEAHVNTAFVGDTVTHDYSSATPDYSVTPDCTTVTDDSHSRDTIVPGTSGPLQGENDFRTSVEGGPVVANSKVTGLAHADEPCQRLQANQLHESFSDESPPNHELAPSAGTALLSTCPRQVACEVPPTPEQVRGTPVDANEEIPQMVVERTTSEGRTEEQAV